VLRHFARSVQDVPIARTTALRFAVRLLRSAGCAAAARALLRRLPAIDTAARYETSGRARAYRDRSAARTVRELELLGRVWPGCAGETVLDAPCGTGRLLEFLRTRGHGVVQADRALAMLRSQQRPPGIAALQAHSLALPLRDGAVDGVVVFRLLHHLGRAAARAAVAEACRVARRFVVVSFFHPCSSHHASRRLRDLLRRRAPTRHAITLSRLRRWCRGLGFEPLGHGAELPWVRDLWVAAFERRRRG
jgi:SAM-dependent methyltransferase